jgi:iron complex outermembrane recepter protein
MSSNSTLSYAIAAILGGISVTPVFAADASGTADTRSDSIQEIVVTAQRRSENLQDVPITIQALTAETLAELNVATFDDMVKYLPNVTVASYGPGQNNVYMRGLSIGTQSLQDTGAVGQIPNVAVYLDEQSVALPGRNLDVYAADIERIEVLEGPQGTLFGSGAEAGVLRYITNKPKLDVTEANVNAGYSYTAHGDPNSNADGMLNVPIIPGALALRVVIYDDSRGGYINNVPETFVRAGTDESFARGNGGVVPTDSIAINNNNMVGSAINPLTYQGLRVSILGKINDDWNILLSQSYQNMNAQGVFYQMPFASNGTTFSATGTPIGSVPLPHLSVNLFNPSYDKDKFENTALTINGRIGDLKLAYSGGYLDRNVSQVQDYTNYARGVYASYYQCIGLSPTSAAAGKCFSPSSTWHDTENNTHLTQEIRLSTPDHLRARALAGLFYEQFVIEENPEWLYKTVPACSPTFNVNCFNNIQPFANSYSSNPAVRNDNTSTFSDEQRTIDQKAIFASIDVDLIPKLTLTLGTRYYRFNEEEVGQVVGSFNCKVYAPTTYFGPCLAPFGTNVNEQIPHSSAYSGFRSRANLSYKVTDDALVYFTWSQGFRPGGFNVGTSAHFPINGVDQYFTPITYAPDTLTNNEIGFKTLWFNRRLQLNGAAYQEDWKNTQTSLYDPAQGLGLYVISTNGGDYQVRGGELQLVAKVTEGLTIQSSSSYNHSKQTNSPFLISNNPASPTFGQPITSVPNPFGPVGSPLANSPQLQWNIRIRDEMLLADYKGFWQIGAQHIGNSLSATGNVQSFIMESYTTYDASAGISKGAWNVELFGQNLTSVNASAYTSASQFVEAQTVIRPRVAGIKFGYKF